MKKQIQTGIFMSVKHIKISKKMLMRVIKQNPLFQKLKHVENIIKSSNCEIMV